MEEAGETAAREVENQLEESGPMKMKAHWKGRSQQCQMAQKDQVRLFSFLQIGTSFLESILIISITLI